MPEMVKELGVPRGTVYSIPSYSVPETAVLLDITVKKVYEQIRLGNLEAASFGNKFRIRRDDIHWWLVQHKKELESEE